MKLARTDISDVLLLEPKVFADERGYFYESFNRRAFRDESGLDVEFVQDNVSGSVRNVLRGLHYQIRQPQGKLVRVLSGEIWDVAVDLRAQSPSFGKWVGYALTAESKRAAWIPPGFAHGYVVLSESAQVHYKATDYYAPGYERAIRWDDPRLAIQWPRTSQLILSDKDRRAALFEVAEIFT